MSDKEEEKKNKRIALFSSIGVQALVLVLLFLIIAWSPPDPPLPEYGIELNFGMDTEGGGDVQPETPVGNEGDQPEQAAQPEPEEVQPEVTQDPVVAENTPTDTKPVEEQIVSKVESPVTVKEKKEEVKPVEKPKEKVEEKKVEPKPVTKPVEESPKAVYKPSTKPATSEKEGDKEGKAGSQGDDKDKAGDKGSPEGTLDAKALYGKPGGGSGGVSMSGFNGFDWPNVQTPTLPDEAYGVYEFLVKVDDQGDVISVTPLRRGLSLEAERKLKEVIQKLVFLPKGSNLPAQSEGKITFRVVSK